MDITSLLPSTQLREMPASVLSPHTWPIDLALLPPATYLVGGSVRDALLGRQAEYLDLDFVLPDNAVQTAKAIAHYYGAGFVLLDAERQIARVVFEKATVDFAQQVGDSLEEDLERRDFTVNAIAYSPHSQEILDPLQGYQDLQQGWLRMIAIENLKEDPLRLLRAYRQAAQLGFVVEPNTQRIIQQLAGLLQFIAAERVQAELGYLLSAAKGTPFLQRAWYDGLLAHWLPHASTASLVTIEQIDRAAVVLEQDWPSLELSGWIRDQQRVSGTGRSWLKLAKLTALVSPDLPVAERELWRLKYSRAEIQSVLMVLKAWPQVQATRLAALSLKEQYTLFRAVGVAFPALAVLAVASGTTIEAIAPLIQRFLTPDDPVAHPTLPVTGRDLMSALQLPPGPQIGQLLEAIQLAKVENKLQTREEALQFAQSMLEFKSD
ncbi:CCA tRNA nucleotidyltransferase [Thermocoleostomius sinensis]|uniref:CCA tRNA nucleotidyltransferase n=1 Tax=Thermocoleostomius sinensis A174 TaxID=2016057 RepID=A0A9E9CA72_9CYAN|nr:CCA tRNA nucleotidyltransferase [Thermocoleostomius sinensis]WAL60587.1 CCA tRNA nucleotidyltransferase [Thermocoleostomius sinensis A174]